MTFDRSWVLLFTVIPVAWVVVSWRRTPQRTKWPLRGRARNSPLCQRRADALVRARPPGRAFALTVNSYGGQTASERVSTSNPLRRAS
jgi:hypothetical protein